MDKISIDKEQLKELLQQNKQMKEDLRAIVSISGEIMEMIAGKSINAVTILSQAPKIISAIQNDPEKANFLQPENIQRIKNQYGP